MPAIDSDPVLPGCAAVATRVTTGRYETKFDAHEIIATFISGDLNAEIDCASL
jgi:hypothetical protein